MQKQIKWASLITPTMPFGTSLPAQNKTLGITYTQMEAMGVLTPLAELSCRYLSPARYEDELTVEVRLVKLTRVKLEFAYAIYKENSDKPLNTGRTVHAMVDSSMKPVNVEKKHPELYAKLVFALEKEG